MKNYYRIMLGKKSIYAEDCLKGNFIGVDFDVHEDLTGKLTENWRDFNHEWIPKLIKQTPDMSKIAAGLACGALHTVAKGIRIGDVILSPNGKGGYMVGEVTGDYVYRPGEILFHRRAVRWLNRIIDRQEMSDSLRHSSGSIGTVSNITKYSGEIESLIGGEVIPTLISTDAEVEDPSVFALEKHLEEFLVANWHQTALGSRYDIYKLEGELVGQQFLTDTGPIDILAVSTDGLELLVVELKKGRASDAVVGQIQRYMGYVLEELAEKNQTVKGVIIALDDDIRIRRALAVTNNIEFYRYQVSFKLFKS